MNNFTKYILIIFLLSFIIAVNFTSCKKDTDCTVEIITKLYSDTSVILPGVYVKLEKYDVKVEGYTNSSGIFTHVFPLEAILDVVAADSSSSPYLQGETSVRLQPGKTVRKTVFLK